MEKNRRKDMGIGRMAGEAAIEVMKNENVQNKTASVIGMLFPYAGVTKKAVDMYIDEIEKADMSPEAKAFYILNIKKTIRGIKNQKAIADIAMENARKGTDFSAVSGVSEEWLERFMDSARFVSTENIQIIWGKILANEFETPGSTPPNMIRILSEFTPDLAEAFKKICSMKVLLCPLSENEDVECYVPRVFVPHKINEKRMGEMGLSFDVLNELEILGVIKQEILKGYIIQGVEHEKMIIAFEKELELVIEHAKGSLPIGNVLLTSAGKALQEIIDVEEVKDYHDMVKKYLICCDVKLAAKHDFVVKDEGDSFEILKKV